MIVCVRVKRMAVLNPSTSAKSRLQDSSPNSFRPSAAYISAYRHRVALNDRDRGDGYNVNLQCVVRFP